MLFTHNHSQGGLIMALAYRLGFLLSFAIMLCLTGCCTKPLICPNGACGPIAFGSTCQGCDHCDGCGELYIDPWINHPADPCDPCHECQGYNPHSCGNTRAVFSGFPSLWGYRSTPLGCDGCRGGCHSCDGGCDSCDSGPAFTDDAQPMEVLEGDGQAMRVIEPTPAGRVIMSGPSNSRYRPHRSREIFRDRQQIAVGDEETIEY